VDTTALFKLSYGLYVVGVQAENKFGGCIVDAVAQVSRADNPNLVLGCMKNNLTNALIKKEGEFTLSILSVDVDPFVVANFGFQSTRDTDKWANVPHTVKNGLPVLDGVVSYLRCRVLEAKELATHTLFLCELIDAENTGSTAKPLIYGDYQATMKDAASEAFNKFKETGKAPLVKAKWRCQTCGYVYDGNIPFEKLPDSWICPRCGSGKELFEKI
jgi:flavin reductase (DIM6/NTAB) family NADH-FMN oxidoreductase RutF/rubredoxin